MHLLPRSFFLANDPVPLAQALLGKVLVTEVDGRLTSARIVETEAYRAPEDRASHAFGNRKTPRTAVFFEAGGLAYVYACYGIHSLFNIVTGEEGVPHAVLIRATEPMEGLEHQLSRRKMARPTPHLSNGPGKVSQALGIGRSHYGLAVYDSHSPVRCCDDGLVLDPQQVVASPRVGVDYAGGDALLPWRFRWQGHPYAGR
jgi:DNA-3-methyladenine glycosylase